MRCVVALILYWCIGILYAVSCVRGIVVCIRVSPYPQHINCWFIVFVICMSLYCVLYCCVCMGVCLYPFVLFVCLYWLQYCIVALVVRNWCNARCIVCCVGVSPPSLAHQRALCRSSLLFVVLVSRFQVPCSWCCRS